jgi:phosphoribosylformimino-5-aminoimidazole carboxamide ribotide isomerase
VPWLDAGIGDASAARYLSATLARLKIPAKWVIGLESLSSPEALNEMAEILGWREMIVSLDLKAGAPLTSIARWQTCSPIEIARELLATGISRLIVLDLADVGIGGGTRTLDLCLQIRREFPAIELVAGGGVRGLEDLKELAGAGCNTALVASALHDERLTAEDIQQIENLAH